MRFQRENIATTSRHPARIADCRIFAALGLCKRPSADRTGLLRTTLHNGERTRPRPQAQPAAGPNPPRQGMMAPPILRTRAGAKNSVYYGQAERRYLLGVTVAVVPPPGRLQHAALRFGQAVGGII